MAEDLERETTELLQRLHDIRTQHSGAAALPDPDTVAAQALRLLVSIQPE